MNSNMNKVLIVALVVIVLGAAGYFVMKGGSSYSPSQAISQPVPTSSVPSGTSALGATTGAVKNVAVAGSEYAFSPNTLSINKGDTVVVTFTNNGTFPHSFVINEFNVNSGAVSPGSTATVTFVAEKTGTFTYYCNIDGHREKGMMGTLTVQ